jgi:hypothetical protein
LQILSVFARKCEGWWGHRAKSSKKATLEGGFWYSLLALQLLAARGAELGIGVDSGTAMLAKHCLSSPLFVVA